LEIRKLPFSSKNFREGEAPFRLNFMKKIARILIVTWDGGGNLPPELGLAQKFLQHGHKVRILSHLGTKEDIEKIGAEFVAYRYAEEFSCIHVPASLKEEREQTFGRVIYAPIMAKETLVEIENYKPNLIMVDGIVMYAHIAAESSAIPFISLWHTLYQITKTSLMANIFKEKIDNMNAERERLKIKKVSCFQEHIERAHKVFVLSYPELDFEEKYPSHVHHVGHMRPAFPHSSGFRLKIKN
jgi:UDP:flavonoid glycosyltransferase YjiC (YdhE family)